MTNFIPKLAIPKIGKFVFKQLSNEKTLPPKPTAGEIKQLFFR
jgi:hypothetical protein